MEFLWHSWLPPGGRQSIATLREEADIHLVQILIVVEALLFVGQRVPWIFSMNMTLSLPLLPCGHEVESEHFVPCCPSSSDCLCCALTLDFVYLRPGTPWFADPSAPHVLWFEVIDEEACQSIAFPCRKILSMTEAQM